MSSVPPNASSPASARRQADLDRPAGDRVEIRHIAASGAHALPIGAGECGRIAPTAGRELGDDGIVADAIAAPRVDGDAAGEVEHGDKFRHHGYLTPREG